jgi:hypothetical protein
MTLKKVLYRIEILGLVTLLAASMWQIVATDWWDKQIVEWEIGIQQDVNHSMLFSMSRLAEIMVDNNEQSRRSAQTN